MNSSSYIIKANTKKKTKRKKHDLRNACDVPQDKITTSNSNVDYKTIHYFIVLVFMVAYHKLHNDFSTLKYAILK